MRPRVRAAFSFRHRVLEVDRWRTRRKQRSASAATPTARTINGARVSRIRTFVKAGRVGACRRQQGRGRQAALQAGPAGDGARSRARRAAQEHRGAEVLAPDASGSRRSAKSRLRNVSKRAAGADRRPFRVRATAKTLGFPAIRAMLQSRLSAKSLKYRSFLERRSFAAFLCQARLFHVDENFVA